MRPTRCVQPPRSSLLGASAGAATTHTVVGELPKCAPAAAVSVFLQTVVGFMGGHGEYPSYDVNYTQLNYSETLRLEYDPSKLSFDRIMQAFTPDSLLGCHPAPSAALGCGR